MIYLISFLEALANGLLGVNTALYLKFVLKLTETQTATVFSAMGILGAVLILVFGPLVDRIGVKKSMLVGAATLAAGRLALGYAISPIVAISLFVFMAVGSAIKGSSILIALRNQGKSFKLDYVIFNIAYCIAGFLFDALDKDYSLVFIIAGIVTGLNLIAVMFLTNDKPAVQKAIGPTKYDSTILKTVLLYNTIMIPVTGIFSFMATFVPKWAIAAIGANAPVGKLFESLNPAIIMAIVPLFAYISLKYKLNPYKTAVIGTTLSSLSLFAIGLPGTWMSSVIAVVVLFTMGEAIWSPANMEVSTKLCPEGEEGKYLTISLIPRTIIGFVMSYAIAYNFTHFVYTPQPQFGIPFLIMGAFALLTPIGLMVFKSRLLDSTAKVV